MRLQGHSGGGPGGCGFYSVLFSTSNFSTTKHSEKEERETEVFEDKDKQQGGGERMKERGGVGGGGVVTDFLPEGKSRQRNP